MDARSEWVLAIRQPLREAETITRIISGPGIENVWRRCRDDFALLHPIAAIKYFCGARILAGQFAHDEQIALRQGVETLAGFVERPIDRCDLVTLAAKEMALHLGEFVRLPLGRILRE